MQLVEQRVIKRTHPSWQQIDAMSFAAKNLWNAANYCLRQSYIFGHNVPSYNQMDKLMQPSTEYKTLAAKLAQQVLRLLDKSWKSYFEALAQYKQNPDKFTGKPRLPGYKAKDGRCVCIFTEQATSKKVFKQSGQIKLSGIDYNFDTQVSQSQYCQSRIVPKIDHYVLEIVYEVHDVEPSANQDNIAAIDLGINNLMAVTSNMPGFKPVLVNGKPLKSVNQFFNKKRATLQRRSQLRTSRRIKRLTTRRNHKVKNYLHRASSYLINLLVKSNITKLVIGCNSDWKRNVNIGKANNQQFVQIPHGQLIDMLTYKGTRAGITVIVREESYTSQSSFLDGDKIPDYGSKPQKWKSSGKRIHRGLFKTASFRLLNADVNGSYNILIKEFPNAFGTGDREVLVDPIRVNLDGFRARSLTPF
ncbi:MAG: IS200/IS605 family element transposase accessory protein TnpB [Microcoleus sp. SIO2G3]|nr:IS200/IS605 family element transposase accessory protein TnpB [Microcoleus sp. SIO2G3]